jgi:hypothetical protein
MSGRGQDLVAVISGLQQIAGAAVRTRQSKIQNFLKYSSLKNVSVDDVSKPLKDLSAKDITQKTFMVIDNTAVFGKVMILGHFVNSQFCQGVKSGVGWSMKASLIELRHKFK